MNDKLDYESAHGRPSKTSRVLAIVAIVFGAAAFLTAGPPAVFAWRTFREINSPTFQRGMDGSSYYFAQSFACMAVLLAFIFVVVGMVLVIVGGRWLRRWRLRSA